MKRHIYIIFSKTPSKLGKFIRTVTRSKYNHISIALDENFSKFYSFARYKYDSPLVGGFIEESPLRYNSSIVQIYKISVNRIRYHKVCHQIEKMVNEKEKYIYNTASAMTFLFHRRVLVLDSYTCVEFATYILGLCGVIKYRKKDFYNFQKIATILDSYKIYEGKFLVSPSNDWENDEYNNLNGLFKSTWLTLHHFKKLLKRFLIGK